MNTLRAIKLTPAALAAGAVCLAFLVPRLAGESPVQAGGADLLSLFFADARSIIGKSLVTRADSYFHGGVTMECTDAHGDDPDAHEAHDHAQEAVMEEPGDEARHDVGSRDPWAWINAKVHVQEHRHLEGEELDEIVPWIWAACRAAPNNIEAYTMGWYVLAKMQKQVDQGLAVLEEGIRNNPDNVELEFTKGQCLFSDVKDKAASEAAFMMAREKSLRNAKGDLSSLPEAEAEIFSRSLAYLAFFAKARGDMDSIRAYLRESESSAPDYVVTGQIRRMLEAPEP